MEPFDPTAGELEYGELLKEAYKALPKAVAFKLYGIIYNLAMNGVPMTIITKSTGYSQERIRQIIDSVKAYKESKI